MGKFYFTHTKKLTGDMVKGFMANKPTLLGRVGPFTFYEDPIHGDEENLWAKTPEDELYLTEFRELPTLDEIYSS